MARVSPSLQQIMDGIINQSNTSMIIAMQSEKKLEGCIVQRNFKYYVDDITNSLVDESLAEEDFWYKIGRKLGKIPEYHRDSRSIVFRFHINYRRMAKDLMTLEYLADTIFDGYTICRSPDFIGLIDVHLPNDNRMLGLMDVLEKKVGITGISRFESSPPVDGSQIFLTVGSNLGEILNVYGVDNVETISNNVYDVERNFGIDAARQVLYDEIFAKIGNKDSAALIADFMTCKGVVSPFKKDNPVLKNRGFLSSIAFERPKNDIKNVLRNGLVDTTSSVYSQIITGRLPDVGSASRLFSLEESEEWDWKWEDF